MNTYSTAMHSKLRITTLAICFASIFVTTASANLITNGSFETRTPPFSGPYLPLFAGDPSIDGWMIIAEGIDYVNTFWPAADGAYSIDLNGSSPGDNTPGGLTQSFATQIGHQYNVSFWLGANGGPSNPQQANIGIQTGSSYFGSIYTIPWLHPLPGTWTQYGFSFVAEANVSIIIFESLQLFGDGGITVDNVSVTEDSNPPNDVPEPSTLALIGTALLFMFGFGMMRRYRGHDIMMRLPKQSMKQLAVAILTAATSIAFVSSANASLLTPAYQSQLETWLGQGPLTFASIYTGTPGDPNFNSYAWHAAVDGRGPTFTLMEIPAGTYLTYPTYPSGNELILRTPNIIGGYNPQSWDSLVHYHYVPNDAERTAFIFNLSSHILLRQLLSEKDRGGGGAYQTFNDGATGPAFGGGHDIWTAGNFSGGFARPYSYGESSYGNAFSSGLFIGSHVYVYGLHYSQIETYSFSQATVATEPSTIALIGMALLSLFGFGMMSRRADA